jgi:hypothetical protein
MNFDTTKICKYVCVFLTLFVFFGSMGFFVDRTIHRNDPLESSETNCSTIPIVVNQSIVIQKQVSSLWHWRYLIKQPHQSGTSKVEMRCPTATADANIWYGGRGVGRTDGKILSLYSEFDVLDCHNKRIMVIRTDGFFETMINQNRIIVSLDVRNTKNEVLYYVDKTSFIADDIKLLDTSSTLVARLRRNTLTDLLSATGYTWTITNNGNINPLLLLSIAGHHSFDDVDSKGNKKGDMCNQFYFAMMIIMIIMSILIFCVGAIIVWANYDKIVHLFSQCCAEESHYEETNRVADRTTKAVSIQNDGEPQYESPFLRDAVPLQSVDFANSTDNDNENV